MKKFRFVGIVLTMLSLYALGTVAFATDLNEAETDLANTFSAEEIVDLGIAEVDPSGIPDGVIPIEFDTWEEARQFLLSQPQGIENVERGGELLDSTIINNGIAPRATAATITKTFPKSTGGLFNVTLICKYTSSPTGNIFTEITNVRSSILLAPSQKWEQVSYNLSFTDGFRTVNGTVSGILTQYITINGVTTILSQKGDVASVYFYSTEI